GDQTQQSQRLFGVCHGTATTPEKGGQKPRLDTHPHIEGDAVGVSPKTMGAWVGGDSLALNITAAVVTFVCAGLLFRLGWKVSEARVWRFNSFADVNKADWSARINSTIHAGLVCTLVTICLLTMSFDPVTLVPLGSTVL
ncbi:unnamed protein product, partial [Ectocarpus fasciculatus]